MRSTGGISEDTARGIVEWHGSGALDIARMAQSSPDMRAPLCSHSEHIVAEAVDAFNGECAATLGDVLLRRVPVALGGCWSPPAAAKPPCGSAPSWDGARRSPRRNWKPSKTSAPLFCTNRHALKRRRLETAADLNLPEPVPGDSDQPRGTHEKLRFVGDDSVHSPFGQTQHGSLFITVQTSTFFPAR